jgi:hypothetical protein
MPRGRLTGIEFTSRFCGRELEDLEIDALLLPSNLASIHADKQTTNDGYDTSITITGVFVRTFFDLSSLMTDS